MSTVYLKNQRSEPIQDIIERMPNKFGTWAALLILTLVLLLLLFGWLIKYPDTVTGSIVINARYSPVKLVANTSGKFAAIQFTAKDMVTEGDYIAVIQNPAKTIDMTRINNLIIGFDINKVNAVNSFSSYPGNVSLGEVNAKYYAFLNAFQLFYNYRKKNVSQQQEQNINSQLRSLSVLLQNDKDLRGTKMRNMELAKRIYGRDSTLAAEKATPEDDADRSKIIYLNSKEGVQTINNEINTVQQQIQDQENKLQQLLIERSDKRGQLRLDLLSSYDNLKDEIKAWEQRYVFKAPISGRLDFSRFWNNNQFIQSGEEVFTIVPKENKIIGQVQLPARGAGKVKTGQEVIIKLDNYPYEEYGSVKGIVSDISLVSNAVKTTSGTNTGVVDTYLINVTLSRSLVTNYGSKLAFKYEIKGTADIVLNERRLIERFFDNLKTNISKN